MLDDILQLLNGIDITYVGMSEGDYFELFHVLNDDQPVLEVLVNPDDEIWVSGVAGFGVRVPRLTEGRAHRHRDAELEAAGVDTSAVCLGSVADFIWPRIVTLMAQVYCPTKTTKTTKEN